MNARAMQLIIWSFLRQREAGGREDADQPPPDKSGYNLFNPTPETLMRELTPDGRTRPKARTPWMRVISRSKWITPRYAG